MNDPVLLGAIAVLLGVIVAVLLFVPFVALSYRRRGRFSVRRALAWTAALVYGWSVWTYTLLPLPDPNAIRCAGTNTRLFAFVGEIGDAMGQSAGRPLAMLSDPVVLQVALNVVLFVPLGVFLRLLAGRGVLASALAGLGLSMFIELTQLTGVWGLYPCAYRVFDVDDMLVNTLGAIIGSLLALLFTHRRRTADDVDPDLPRPVTKSRRLVGMVCDWLGYSLLTFGVSVAVQVLLLYALDQRDLALEGRISTLVGIGVGLAVWTTVTLATGSTVGDLAVRLRYAGGPLPEAANRLLRLLGGVGTYGILELLPGSLAPFATVFALGALIITMTTADGRGLPGLLTSRQLADAREPVERH